MERDFESSEPTAARAPERPRVLVVDHNRSNLSVMGRRLTEAGYRVVAAEDSAAAVAALHRQPIDLVIAELYMPRTGGADLARLIRGETAWRDLPLMMVTGRSDPGGAVRAYEAGADDVILKPFHFEVLFARIERRFSRARSLLTLRNDNAALDARVVARAIELGEMRDRLRESESERRRLEQAARRAA